MGQAGYNTSMRRFQFSLRSILLVTTLVAIVCGIGAYIYRQNRLADQRGATLADMRRIMSGMQFYDENSHRPLTPTVDDAQGRPLSSWRWTVIWCVGQTDFVEVPSDPLWSSPNNAEWRKSRVGLCFSEANANNPRAYDTNIFAITGPGTAFDPTLNVPHSLNRLAKDPAVSDTILVVEVRNSKTHWMQPGDFDIRTMPKTIDDPAGEGISGNCPGCFCVGFVDLTVMMLRNDTPFDKLALFFTIESARQHDRDAVLGPFQVK